jgi:hypothetical protein
MMRNPIAWLLAIMLLAVPAAGSGQRGEAATVLAAMRTALGGADRIAAVKTLRARGTTTRVTPRGTVENEIELAMEFPDKYRSRTVVAGEGSMRIFRHAGFNGDAVINEIDAPPNLNAPMRARIGSDRAGAVAGREPTVEEKAEASRRQMLAAKRDFARLMLGMLGSSPAVYPRECTYAAEAAAADGKAHVLDVKGADGFGARLFVDTKTNLPLMLTWSEPRGPAPNAPIVERRLYYTNFQKAGGLNLPHTLQRSVDGTLTEETAFAKVEINPKIDARTCAVSK